MRFAILATALLLANNCSAQVIVISPRALLVSALPVPAKVALVPSTAETMLAVSNRIRAEAPRPLPPQTLDPRLCSAAQDHANYMARYHQPRPNRYFYNPTYSHDSNGGTESRLARHGFRWSGYGENLTLCLPGDRNEPFTDWRNSGPHYATMLRPFALAGFGSAQASDGSTYWAAVYGTEAARPAAQAPAAFVSIGNTCGPAGCSTATYSAPRYVRAYRTGPFRGGCGGAGRSGPIRRVFGWRR